MIQRQYDLILDNIRTFKTTFLNADAVHDKYMHIPIKKSLYVPIAFRTIEYDMSMMAANEINNADEFYKSKWEFWQKYGPVVIFGVIVVFLLIVIVLTYQYMNDITTSIMGQVQSTGNMLTDLMTKNIGGGAAKPPG